jgi:hypothetical protein
LVVLLLRRLLLLRLPFPGMTLGLTGLGLVGRSSGGARKGGSWVGLSQVVPHFFQERKKCGQILL